MALRHVIRGSGVLLAISSLPSEYGIGTLGNEAFRFVDMLIDMKQKYWQVLPIGPTGYGDSPYQVISAFAGSPYLIDLDDLIQRGLLSKEEVLSYKWENDKDKVDYYLLFENRHKILFYAYERFDKENEKFITFCNKKKSWLEDYALYMTLKYEHDGKCWADWEPAVRNREPQALEQCKEQYKDKIVFWKFCQFIFFQQWNSLKRYANSRGISIIGDISLYVGYDSVDVWKNPEMFLLDKDGTPERVAASAPDRYSATGQIWGSPLYDWKYMEEHEFSWWKARIEGQKQLFDFMRFDHFIGIVKEYTVLPMASNTSNGKWIKGPGKKLISKINEVCECQIVADDSASKKYVHGVEKLLEKSGWLSSKVLLFGFDGDTANENLPHNYLNTNNVVYASTHDNETIAGYIKDKSEYELAYLYEYLNIQKKEEIPDALIRAAYASIGDVVIIQMQDILKLENDARMNLPSTVGCNWKWRMKSDQLDMKRIEWIRNLAAVYRR